MLRQLTKNTLNKDIRFLCTRIGALNLSPRFNLHTNVKIENQQNAIPQAALAKQFTNLSPGELLRKEALTVVENSPLRGRCIWLKEEDEKLMAMVNTFGRRWKYLSYHFVDRPSATLMNRYFLLTENNVFGPWKKEELEALKELGKGRTFDEIQNWEEIQAKLPLRRPVYLIKQKYYGSLNPVFKHGRWTEEESSKLAKLVFQHGVSNFEKIALLMGSRNRRQCYERWRWQMSDTKKGRFTADEDAKILEAVKKYGENFAVIAKVTGSDRTPRHISQHYRGVLSPSIDRTPWTYEEQATVYATCLKHDKNMTKTKEELKSRRAIRDMWNHYKTHERQLKKNQTTIKNKAV